MTNEEMKAAMMKAVEGKVDELLKAREGGKRLTLTEIEDMVLAARQEMGQKLTECLIEDQQTSREQKTPISAVSGKRLEYRSSIKIVLIKDKRSSGSLCGWKESQIPP